MVSHARALLAGTGAIALQGDLADPDAILADPVLQRLITLAEPAAVLLAMVLYFIGYYEKSALGSSPNSATAWHPAATWSSRSAARTAPTPEILAEATPDPRGRADAVALRSRVQIMESP